MFLFRFCRINKCCFQRLLMYAHFTASVNGSVRSLIRNVNAMEMRSHLHCKQKITIIFLNCKLIEETFSYNWSKNFLVDAGNFEYLTNVVELSHFRQHYSKIFRMHKFISISLPFMRNRIHSVIQATLKLSRSRQITFPTQKILCCKQYSYIQM